MIILAPIQGITDMVFRNVFPKHFGGVDLAMAPFISTSKRKKVETVILRELDPALNTGIPVIPQVLSNDPEDFIPLADRLYDMGYGTVNWNLGCPFPVVVNKTKGSGMLCYPVKIEQFLEKTIPAIKAKLSIKLRLGLVYPDEILSLIPIFNRYPLEEIIIHPRTGRQMYNGDVDLDMFGRCLEMSRHRVVYNGDITSREKYMKIRDRFPSVDRWMIGRGLISSPFLAEEIVTGKTGLRNEQLQKLRQFHDELFSAYSEKMSGPSHITDKMKGIWAYLGDSFEHPEKVKKKTGKAQNVNHYLDVVNDIFSGSAAPGHVTPGNRPLEP